MNHVIKYDLKCLYYFIIFLSDHVFHLCKVEAFLLVTIVVIILQQKLSPGEASLSRQRWFFLLVFVNPIK